MTEVTHNGATPNPDAELTLTPTSLSFGDQTVGTESAARSVTLSNTGSVEITGLGYSEQSSEYSAGGIGDTCDDTLAAGAECSIPVRFTPTSEGLKTATLSIDSSQTDAQTVSLSGTGVSDAPPADTDGDGIPDSIDPDDDNDGMSDEFEDDYGFDSLDPSDANEDWDVDGYTNLEEYLGGSNPTDPDDMPENHKNEALPSIIMYLTNP